MRHQKKNDLFLVPFFFLFFFCELKAETTRQSFMYALSFSWCTHALLLSDSLFLFFVFLLLYHHRSFFIRFLLSLSLFFFALLFHLFFFLNVLYTSHTHTHTHTSAMTSEFLTVCFFFFPPFLSITCFVFLFCLARQVLRLNGVLAFLFPFPGSMFRWLQDERTCLGAVKKQRSVEVTVRVFFCLLL